MIARISAALPHVPRNAIRSELGQSIIVDAHIFTLLLQTPPINNNLNVNIAIIFIIIILVVVLRIVIPSTARTRDADVTLSNFLGGKVQFEPEAIPPTTVSHA